RLPSRPMSSQRCLVGLVGADADRVFNGRDVCCHLRCAMPAARRMAPITLSLDRDYNVLNLHFGTKRTKNPLRRAVVSRVALGMLARPRLCSPARPYLNKNTAASEGRRAFLPVL